LGLNIVVILIIYFLLFVLLTATRKDWLRRIFDFARERLFYA